MVQSKFEVGDRVRVKTLDEICSKFGDGYSLPVAFVRSMHQYCGHEFVVINVKKVLNTVTYNLLGAGTWNFDERTLDFAHEGPRGITIDFAQLFE